MKNEATGQLVDAIGFFGNLFEYACVIALGSSTLLVFLYLWRRGRLGYDEEDWVAEGDLNAPALLDEYEQRVRRSQGRLAVMQMED